MLSHEMNENHSALMLSDQSQIMKSSSQNTGKTSETRHKHKGMFSSQILTSISTAARLPSFHASSKALPCTATDCLPQQSISQTENATPEKPQSKPKLAQPARGHRWQPGIFRPTPTLDPQRATFNTLIKSIKTPNSSCFSQCQDLQIYRILVFVPHGFYP